MSKPNTISVAQLKQAVDAAVRDLSEDEARNTAAGAIDPTFPTTTMGYFPPDPIVVI